MKALFALYDWSEKHVWNTLTKKLMSFLFLSVFNLAFVGIYVYERDTITDILRAASADQALVAPVVAALEHGLTWTIILYVVVVFFSLLQVAYMRHLIVRPVKKITQVFDQLACSEGDVRVVYE